MPQKTWKPCMPVSVKNQAPKIPLLPQPTASFAYSTIWPPRKSAPSTIVVEIQFANL